MHSFPHWKLIIFSWTRTNIAHTNIAHKSMLHIANFLNRMSRCGHIKDYHTFDILKREEQETETIRQWRRSRCDVGNRHRLRKTPRWCPWSPWHHGQWGHIGENGVILDKIFIFQLFLFVFIFYEIFFTYIVKYPLVYLLYFLFFFPFENKGVVTIFTKSIFCTFVKKRGVKLDRRCLRLDSAN
jgi:hypothetical protein